MFQIKTDIRIVALRSRNLWVWTVIVDLTEGDWPTRTFEVTGLSTSLDSAQAEMLWAERLTELKLHSVGYTPAE